MLPNDHLWHFKLKTQDIPLTRVVVYTHQQRVALASRGFWFRAVCLTDLSPKGGPVSFKSRNVPWVPEKDCTVIALVSCVCAQSCLTLCDPTDCSPPGSSAMGFSRQGHWSGLPFSPLGNYSPPGDWTHASSVFCVCRQRLYPSVSSVQFSCSVVSDSLRPHGLQHARTPCPSPAPGVYSDSCPSSLWCRPTISSSVFTTRCHHISLQKCAFQSADLQWTENWRRFYSCYTLLKSTKSRANVFWILNFVVVQSLNHVCSLWPHGLQHTRLPCPSLSPGVYSNPVHWVGDAVQPSHPLLPPSPPAFHLSQHQGLTLLTSYSLI